MIKAFRVGLLASLVLWALIAFTAVTVRSAFAVPTTGGYLLVKPAPKFRLYATYRSCGRWVTATYAFRSWNRLRANRFAFKRAHREAKFRWEVV